MLFKNVFIENSKNAKDIRVENGKFAAIAESLTPGDGEEIVDCSGKMVLPPFIESHVHLDTCLTAGQPRWNMSGTLFEGIDCWEARKETLSLEDVVERVNKLVRIQASNGIQYVRTHIDINDPELTALKAVLDLREKLREYIDIQIVAFPQYGILSYPKGKELLEEALIMGDPA